MNKKIIGVIAFAVIIVAVYFVYDNYKEVEIADKNQTEKVETIKIGAILPLTGPAGSLGDYYKNGLELKVKELNSSGGFDGREVELIIEDSKSSAKDGVNAVQRLITLNPLFVFSHLSSVTLAINPILEKKDIPVIAVSASDQLLVYKYAIRNYIKPDRLAKFAFQNFSEKLDINDFALIYVNDDFGRSVANNFKEACMTKDVKISHEEVFSLTNNDYRGIVSKIIEQQSKAVYITGYGKPLGLFIKQLREGGYKGIICTGIEITQPEVIDFLGDYATEIYFPNLLFNNNLVQNKGFNDAYVKNYNRESFSAAALAYDGVQIMLNAFKDANYDNQKFILNMEKESSFNSLNGLVKIINREIIYPFTLNKLSNSKIIPVD